MARQGLVLTGPTATGKTALSIELAERLHGEIISMDSRQVYRGMDIGTAKPTRQQRARVPHHGLDLVDLDERYSAGRFGLDARRWIAEIRSRGHVPILAGGTGFFLRALTHPLFEEPTLPPERRERLKRFLARRPAAELHRWVEALDPQSARTLAARRGGAGRQRLARALEVALLSGRTLLWWHTHAPRQAEPLALTIFVLWLPREQLYGRIDERVTEMMEAGLLEEVERLLAEGYDPQDPGMNATGYIELVPYFTGACTRDEAMQQIRAATHRYARRQMTWCRHQLPPGAHWLDASRPRAELLDEIARLWREEVAA